MLAPNGFDDGITTHLEPHRVANDRLVSGTLRADHLETRFEAEPAAVALGFE